MFFLLRTQDYRHMGYEIKLSRPTNIPVEIISVVRDSFDRVYRQDVKYRLTGIVLSDLSGEGNAQLDLFGATIGVCAECVQKITT